MSKFPILTSNMRPGALSDCQLPGCVPITGGLCAFVPNTPMWWCCQPYDSSCWSMPKLCNYTETDELVSQILCRVPAPGSSWCCNSMFESCPPDLTVQRCAPLDFPNPVLDGPTWRATPIEVTPVSTFFPSAGTTAISSAAMSGTPQTTPQPTPRKHTSPAAIGAGVVVAIALIGSGAYFLWRRLGRNAEAVPLPEPMPEVCGETRPIRELSGEKEPQELDSAGLYEMCAAAEQVSRV